MFAAERRQLILQLVQANGAVSLRDLASAAGSSEVTIRRDVRALEDEGLLDRRHGGAVRTGGLAHEASYSQKRVVAAAEKAAIAELAATLVGEGDAIVVGAGTTTLELSRRLVRLSDLTVVTTSILIAQTLASAPAEVVLTGGILRGATYALVGSATEQSLAGLRVQRAFISGNGLSPGHGLSTPNMMVASVDRAIVAAAQEVVLLVDHTKLGVDTMFQTVPPAAITHLITDDRADPELLEQFAAMGVSIRIAPVGPAPVGTLPIHPVPSRTAARTAPGAGSANSPAGAGSGNSPERRGLRAPAPTGGPQDQLATVQQADIPAVGRGSSGGR